MDTEEIEIENLDTPEGESESTETPTVEAPQAPLPSEEDVAAKEADAALASEGAAESEESEESEGPEYKPDFKFKAAGKDHEIPEMFRGLITDEKSDREVKQLFQKALGADVLIEKSKKLEGSNSSLVSENTNIKGAIDGLRNLFTEASKPGGNILKFDQWLERVRIPEEFILNYAIAKVKLMEMPPEQRNAILAQMDSEKRTDALNQERDNLQGQNLDTVRRLKQLELDGQLAKPEVLGYADQFDKRIGKPGAFRDAVVRTGELAWHRQKLDLSPDQAIKQVIADYNLVLPDPASSAPSQAPNGNPGAVQTRTIVQRTSKVIPNVQGKGSQSPLKQKPRSIEDIKKLAARAAAGEAV